MGGSISTENFTKPNPEETVVNTITDKIMNKYIQSISLPNVWSRQKVNVTDCIPEGFDTDFLITKMHYKGYRLWSDVETYGGASNKFTYWYVWKQH